MKKYIAEFIGTFWLVLGGCGSAVIALRSLANDPITLGEGIRYPIGIGLLGVSFAFGLTVLTMAYAIGHISGCHLNPAVSFGLWAGKRFPGSELLPYIISQVLGAILAGFFVYLLASGKAGFVIPDGNPLASNGYGDHSPEGYGLVTCFITEAIMTFMFLIVILGSTDRRAPAGFAPLAIGLGLTLIHLITIPITATSVNPARSTGPAIVAAIVGQPALVGQLWMFWIAPILGALLAGWLYASVFAETRAERIEAEAQAQEGVEV